MLISVVGDSEGTKKEMNDSKDTKHDKHSKETEDEFPFTLFPATIRLSSSQELHDADEEYKRRHCEEEEYNRIKDIRIELIKKLFYGHY